MNHSSFNEELFRIFPPLRELARTRFEFMGDEAPGSYLVFEDILVPEINKAAGSDEEYFVRLMNFVEQVAKPGIGACDDLVIIGLGERIKSLSHADSIRSAAGPNTMRAIWKGETTNWYRGPIASLIDKLLLPRKAKRAD
jgi:hypothetical protein